MKHIPQTATMKHQNGTDCVVLEYGAGEHLDVAVATIHGRYPTAGFAVNEQSEEAVYITKGTGKVVTKTIKKALKEGDAVFIQPQEAYYFEGDNLQLVITCTPPWTPTQHKEIM